MPLPFYFFIPLMKEFTYDDDPLDDDPLIFDDDGLYITKSQMKFWLNNKKNRKLLKKGSSRFLKYYSSCRTYNLVSDMLEDDPECAFLYWDEKKGVPAFSFPVNGIVAQTFIDLGLLEDK